MLYLAQEGNERLSRELSLVCKGKPQRHRGHREQKEASGGKGEGRSEAALGLMGHRHTPHPRLRERCAPCPSCSPCFSVPSVSLWFICVCPLAPRPVRSVKRRGWGKRCSALPGHGRPTRRSGDTIW